MLSPFAVGKDIMQGHRPPRDAVVQKHKHNNNINKSAQLSYSKHFDHNNASFSVSSCRSSGGRRTRRSQSSLWSPSSSFPRGGLSELYFNRHGYRIPFTGGIYPRSYPNCHGDGASTSRPFPCQDCNCHSPRLGRTWLDGSRPRRGSSQLPLSQPFAQDRLHNHHVALPCPNRHGYCDSLYPRPDLASTLALAIPGPRHRHRYGTRSSRSPAASRI